MAVLRNWIFSALAIYALFGAIVYYFQKEMIYFPQSTKLTDCQMASGAEYWRQGQEQGIFTDNKGKNLYIFFHGNAGAACNWSGLGNSSLKNIDFDTLAVEYPGYSGDKRQPSKAAIEETLKIVNDWVNAQDYETVTVGGFSLGSGVASRYAELYSVDQIILFSPFDSVYAVALRQGLLFPRFILSEDFDNIQSLENVNVPIRLLYSTADTVIPTERSDALYNHLANMGKDVQRVLHHGGEHGELFSNPIYVGFLYKHLEGISKE